MAHNNVGICAMLRLITISVMLLLSGQALAGKLTIVNGDQNKGTVFTFSPNAGQYDCFYHYRNVLGEKHPVGPGGNFSFIVTNSCSGSPVRFSIYTKVAGREMRIAFAMHGDGGFEYIPIKPETGGYNCEEKETKCLSYSA